MQLSREPDPVHFGLGEPEALGEHRGELGDLADVLDQAGAALAEHGQEHVGALAEGGGPPCLALVHALVGQVERLRG